ncbi:MAG: 4-hydroxy-3-methylbut-2-enyl diphosphate reductase [Candidatus Aminicenantes bacterium]|nr:4-hydroxy-3-methylbut-2-enyl diphosphate reductase [Candidatus Aminicenantes bacterium]
MQITFSQNLSYCFGVKRTLTLAEKLLKENPDKSYYMLGEIVHNEHVINDLKSKGLRIIYDPDQIESHGTVIIQSHGASRATFRKLRDRNIDFIDATCPMVGVIHNKIRKLEEDGYFPVIIGKKGHDEAIGIAGQVSKSLVIRRVEEVSPARFKGRDKVGIVVQSTFIRAEALAIMEKIKTVVPEVKFIDTICRPTTERQTEIESIAGTYDCILIVGSKTSANTQHLFTLASGTKSRVYLIDEPESVQDLPIGSDESVFIASGASTPMSLIEQVVSLLTKQE